MNRTDFIKAVSMNTDTKQTDVKRILKEAFSIIELLCRENESVRIPDFGTFKPVIRKERMGWNFQAGEKIEIPAYFAITFKPVAAMKLRLNNGE